MDPATTAQLTDQLLAKTTEITAEGVLLLAGAGLLATVGYRISLAIHPYVRCGWCRGRGRDYGEVYRRAFGDCHHCKGTGRKLRLGVRLLHTGRRR
ncbi:hypothetical protein [Actinopolymorpha sp. B9G3]|uniref:hypothetical protein n=1 Tax=Actinopolymorpha sp. B9G3 TaxID=3158970 RepID=UPI0032D8FAE0